MKKFLTEELFKGLLALLTTAIGVYWGISWNKGVEKEKAGDSYSAMLKAVRIEASENLQLLKGPFEQSYRSKLVVYSDLSNTISNQYLANEVFLSNAPNSLIVIMSGCNIHLMRLNKFKTADEKYKYDSLTYSAWAKPLTIAFGQTIQSASNEEIAIIEAVNAINP